nr:MAG TPA: Esterase GDSL/SGNH-like Acyl-Esterase family found in Pmr5 and Cas1p [Caudoviricetes sp.]
MFFICIHFCLPSRFYRPFLYLDYSIAYPLTYVNTF